jgi:hypothetical protein
MNDSKILALNSGNGNARDAFGGWRKSREECKWEMAGRIPEFGAVGAIPGIDGVELFQLGDVGAFDHADQVQASVGDGACAVGEAD